MRVENEWTMNLLIEIRKNNDKWQEIVKIENKDKYELTKLTHNSKYAIRGRLQNQYGYGPYSDVTRFITSLVFIQSFMNVVLVHV